ncbi:MAG: hypothetical protein GXC73_14960 [Chitinophagaceae bacterium]|nr:hypothetical protein [Chitinophagaceae bacterium]
MQKDLVDFLLDELRPRPGMYLTAYNFSYLNIYLTGVDITCCQLNKSGEYLERFSGENGFLHWSWRKYDLGHPSARLYHYLEFANGNEKEALDLFFEDLELFHSETKR